MIIRKNSNYFNIQIKVNIVKISFADICIV